VTVVTHFWSAPVGIHVCLRLHTNLDPSSYNTFAAVLNYLSYIVLKTPPFSMQSMVASIYCAFVTPNPRFWCWWASLNLFAARDPAMSEYFARASSNNNVCNRCLSTLRTSEVSPILAMAQILPLTNPSTSVGGTSAHWHPSWVSKPCWAWRHSFTLTLSSSCLR